jgi:hypothetical protein
MAFRAYDLALGDLLENGVPRRIRENGADVELLKLTAALTELLQRRRGARLVGSQQRSFTQRLHAALARARTATA